MKNLLFTLALLIGNIVISNAQENDFPNVTSDNFTKQNYTIGIQTRFQLPMPLGLGVDGSFYLPNIFHIDAEAGYGWTYVYDKPEGSQAKSFMPWVRSHVGWPFHIKTSGNIRYATSFSESTTSLGNKSTEVSYYKLNVPKHHFIIPEVGIYINPMGKKLSAVDRRTFLTKNLAFGLAYKVMTNVNVKVKDSKTGKVYSGPFKSYGHIRAGILKPLADQIDLPGSSPVLKSDKAKFYANVQWNVPYYDYGFGLGLESLGYDNKLALYFTWTFYIK